MLLPGNVCLTPVVKQDADGQKLREKVLLGTLVKLRGKLRDKMNPLSHLAWEQHAPSPASGNRYSC